MADFASGYHVTNAKAWTQVQQDSFVFVKGGDSWMEGYNAYVSPDAGSTLYNVGYRSDDFNGNTQWTSFYFNVPAGWYFIDMAENGADAWVYPIKKRDVYFGSWFVKY